VRCNGTIGAMNQVKRCENCGEAIRRELRWCSRCEFMSQQEAMARLHISRNTYYRYIARGLLHPRLIGVRTVLLWRPEIEALLEASIGRHGPACAPIAGKLARRI
jgi:predicted DNA-binding transcriptional regulator AlpA